MSVDARPQERAAIADPARIRELMLANLFAVFNERDPKRRSKAIARNYTEGVICLLRFNLGMPKQPPAVSGVDVALVRDGRIAVLYTLLTPQL
jgi:hypothetical protein